MQNDGDKKHQTLKKCKKIKSQIQCFLKEKPMFYLERQNRKNEKMENENLKNQNLKKKYQISDSMCSRGKTYVFPLETKSKVLKIKR